MRLIDADELINQGYEIVVDGLQYDTCNKSIDIDDIPTAYSVDKVVEKLEKNASRYTKKYLTPYGNNGYRDTKAISIHKAIEIVKQGGVSTDVCEWNQIESSVGLKTYKISCCGKTLEMPVSTARGLKYCTYCGKKIKAVEYDN